MIALRAGASLGQYELVRAIGSGGMGVVYEARHQRLGRRVALKVLHTRDTGLSDASVAAKRFLREGRAAAQVQHAHVVDVFDFGVEDGVSYLVMELVDGETLAQRIAREGALPLPKVAELLLPIVSAVAELHAAGVLHRDLKPANILLARERGGEICPKVADFGVSRLDDGEPAVTESNAVMGTYAYMSPEQARSTKTTTERADQYALGVILYECATGTKPFEAEATYDLLHAIMNAPLIAPSERNPALPKAFDAMVLRAMSRDPNARFAAVEEIGEALLAFAQPRVVTKWASEFRPSWSRENDGSVSGQAVESARVRPASTSSGRRSAPSKALLAALSAIVVLAALVARLTMSGARITSAPVPSAAEAHALTSPTVAPAASVETAPAPQPRPDTSAVVATPAPPPTTAPSSAPAPPKARAQKANPVAPSPPAPHRKNAPVDDNGAPILDPE